MFEFYEKQGFGLFPCNLDKSPAVKSPHSTECHISAEEAQKLADRGRFIGAKLPQNYVVIDLDRNHKNGVDGVEAFKQLCKKLKIEPPETLTVKTGSGGLHLYFKHDADYATLSQKSLSEAVDVRTHFGYVIAAGTNGYFSVSDAEVQELPEQLLTLIQTRNKDRAAEFSPERALPVDQLKRVLNRIDASTHFSTNDSWQEFVISCIAVSGNSDEVLDVIEAWSKTDPKYASDDSIRRRIETFEPSGGIGPGTFIHLLKRVGTSKHLIDKVRLLIGSQFSFNEKFAESFEPPFEVDFDLTEIKDLMASFYYRKHQAAAIETFTALCAEKFLYSLNDRAFFYFDGNKWIETPGAMQIVFSVLVNACQRFYTDYSKGSDGDADDIMSSCLNYLGSISNLSRFEQILKQHSAVIRKEVDWDSEKLEGTLTLNDCVMDFSDPSQSILFRRGTPEEYRRLAIELNQADFKNKKAPTVFKQFLAEVFPNTETRKTATYALSTMLSGTGKFRKFQIWNGPGSNGKSTLMEIMKSTIGQRAISYKADVLLNKQHANSLTPELAVFRGALVAFASETEESKRVSQGAVKALTGNETMTANPKYKGMIEFKTTFQLVLSTNYLPAFSAHDNAFIDRVLILPFYSNFYNSEEQKDAAERRGSKYFYPAQDLTKRLNDIRSERAQILFYLAKRYQELTAEIPESDECLQSKRHYIDDNNDIVQFLQEFVEYDPDHGHKYFTPTRDLVNFYNSENNTRYSSKFVIMRLKEVYPYVETASRLVNGKLTRGIRNVRLKWGAYPEGYQGNYTPEEIRDAELGLGDAANF
jgi:P4 family phage/plasmid primase-like protien